MATQAQSKITIRSRLSELLDEHDRTVTSLQLETRIARSTIERMKRPVLDKDVGIHQIALVAHELGVEIGDIVSYDCSQSL